jgi:uncharacterized protein (UPF0332 family)
VAFADDLLEQSHHLARRERNRPKQASLRRAVSTAYYSLFHLLIGDAVLCWKLPSQRPALARAYDHSRMKGACMRCASADADLKTVANAFVELQQLRHRADYDNGKTWARIEAISEIDQAGAAFESWQRVREKKIAQDFLLSMLVDRK